MTALAEFLFPAPARRRTLDIVRWWESRRLAYNAVVGTTGLVSLGVVQVVASLPPDAHGGLFFPWQPVLAFGVLANVCYLLGPTVELVVAKLWGDRVLPVGPALFRMGLTFSVGLTLLPSLMVGLEWLYRIARAVIG